ncbi:MAG: hypothetical protein A2176_05470 [Spirochaetes bacterium RBG_13_51_14]|nr:MAG: hypothetical protein A2176_05470 [Spirochaetes bacterium RBG_13_51_14]
MKQVMTLLAVMILLSNAIIAAEKPKEALSNTMTLSGTIIDNLCAKAHKTSIESFIKTHTKECALMPDCAASGYSLYHYGALIPFDNESSQKIEQFLKIKDSSLNVTVVVEKAAGDTYSLISIRNQ